MINSGKFCVCAYYLAANNVEDVANFVEVAANIADETDFGTCFQHFAAGGLFDDYSVDFIKNDRFNQLKIL